MSQLLNSVKRGITKVLGKEFTVPTEDTRQEWIVKNGDTIQVDYILTLGAETQKVTDSFKQLSFALGKLSITSYIEQCESCTHEKDAHNPDKRMKSGFGMCVCGKCKKYISPWAMLASVKVPSITFKPRSLTQLTTMGNYTIPVSSGSSLGNIVLFRANYPTSITAPYIQTVTKSLSTIIVRVSQVELAFMNNPDPYTIAKDALLRMCPTKTLSDFTIISIDEYKEMAGDITVTIGYYEN